MTVSGVTEPDDEASDQSTLPSEPFSFATEKAEPVRFTTVTVESTSQVQFPPGPPFEVIVALLTPTATAAPFEAAASLLSPFRLDADARPVVPPRRRNPASTTTRATRLGARVHRVQAPLPVPLCATRWKLLTAAALQAAGDPAWARGY